MVSLALITACGTCGTPANATSPSAASPTAVPLTTAQTLPAQAELAAAFQRSTVALFEAKQQSDFANFKPLNQTTLSPEPTGLKIVATGTDPGILLPPFAEGRPSIVQVVIDSPHDTPFQAFYSLREERGFTESKSFLVPLKRGRNILYVPLDRPNLVDPVRFDPGASPGEYVIVSVLARGISKQ